MRKNSLPGNILILIISAMIAISTISCSLFSQTPAVQEKAKTEVPRSLTDPVKTPMATRIDPSPVPTTEVIKPSQETQNNSTVGSPDAQMAAEAFAAALYTVDYQKDQAVWLSDYKTHAFYVLFDAMLKPALWTHIASHSIVSTAKAQNSEFYYEEKADTKGQIWKVEVTLDQAWPENPLPPSNPQSLFGFPWPDSTEVTVYILVSNTRNPSEWEVYGVFEQAQAENIKKQGN